MGNQKSDNARIALHEATASAHAALYTTQSRSWRRSQHPAASSNRLDHSTFNPQSKPRLRAGVRGL